MPSRLEELRKYPCAVMDDPGWEPEGDLRCAGPVEAHHHTHGRGMGQKVDDEQTFPLCAKHHHDFHAAQGMFRTWVKAVRRDWQDRMVERYNRILCDPEAF